MMGFHATKMNSPNVLNEVTAEMDAGCRAAATWWATPWYSTPSAASHTNSSVTPTSSFPTHQWSCCCDALFLSHVLLFLCLYAGFPTLYLLPSLHIPFLPHSTRMFVFTEQLFCHHATWVPVKANSGEHWTSGCCLLPTHVDSDLGAKWLCDFALDARAFCSPCRN